jgi:hypothetical protein
MPLAQYNAGVLMGWCLQDVGCRFQGRLAPVALLYLQPLVYC